MKITVSLAQMEVSPSGFEENLEKGEALVDEAARRSSDVIVFPEMWTTGFNWETNKRIVKEHEMAIERIGRMAKRYHIWINGSTLALDEEGRPSNTSILFDPAGEKPGTYRKTHLFKEIHEEERVSSGKSLCLVSAPWGLTGLSICYDIRFPELFRTYALKGVKIIFLPAAFPYPKLHHWKTLVRARAIENQLFMVGTNRVGSEDLGRGQILTYFGDSMIIDPWGDTVAEASETEEDLLTAVLNIDRVNEVRSKMKVLEDRRPELYDLG